MVACRIVSARWLVLRGKRNETDGRRTGDGDLRSVNEVELDGE